MKVYWSPQDVPELKHLSPELRKQVWQTCFRQYAFKHWQVWVSLLLMAALISVGQKTAGILGSALAGGFGGLLFGQTTTTVLRPHFRRYLNQRSGGWDEESTP